MQRVAVQSSNVISVGFGPADVPVKFGEEEDSEVVDVLEVEFKGYTKRDGTEIPPSIYRYRGAPITRDVYERLISGKVSVGRTVSELVRDPDVKAERVTETQVF